MKGRILKNTCVFAVRLHLGLIDKARAELARTSSSFISEQYPSGSASGAPMRVHFGVPKSVPKRCRSHVEPILLERCNVNVFLLLQKRGGRFPGTTPPLFGPSAGPRQNHHFGLIVDRGVQLSLPGFQGPPLVDRWHRGGGNNTPVTVEHGGGFQKGVPNT